MHIPPQMLGLLPGMMPLGKMDKAKKKQRLKKTASASYMDGMDEISEDEEDEFSLSRAPVHSKDDPPQQKAGGKPRERQLSDKVIKSLLEAQEKTLAR
jgi:hypothetical protein